MFICHCEILTRCLQIHLLQIFKLKNETKSFKKIDSKENPIICHCGFVFLVCITEQPLLFSTTVAVPTTHPSFDDILC